MATLVHYAKYVWRFRSAIAVLLFVVIAGFVDKYSFWSLFRLWQQNNELSARIAQYRKEYDNDTHELHLLETSPEAIEKVARMNLLMKTDDEDIYVVVEE